MYQDTEATEIETIKLVQILVFHSSPLIICDPHQKTKETGL